MTLQYQIEFFTYWHAGSGLSGGAYADLLVNKTKEGLPFIPGKTLKGMIRDGATTISDFDPSPDTVDFINQVFGGKPTKVSVEETDSNPVEPGICFFSNAELSGDLTAQLLQDEKNKNFGQHFYEVLASTRIDDYGVADDHTLRQMEVTIPLTLYATIENFPDDSAALARMQRFMSAIKRMGLGRTRGLGRCQFSLINPKV